MCFNDKRLRPVRQANASSLQEVSHSENSEVSIAIKIQPTMFTITKHKRTIHRRKRIGSMREKNKIRQIYSWYVLFYYGCQPRNKIRTDLLILSLLSKQVSIALETALSLSVGYMIHVEGALCCGGFDVIVIYCRFVYHLFSSVFYFIFT